MNDFNEMEEGLAGQDTLRAGSFISGGGQGYQEGAEIRAGSHFSIG